MERRTTRALGVLAAIGGILATLVWVPPGWYGSTTGDSYVFDPPTFSPLWVERTVVPLLTVLAAAFLVAGLLALVAGPALTVGIFALFFVVDVGAVGSVLLVAPTGLAFVVVGYELWTHPDPVQGSNGDTADRPSTEPPGGTPGAGGEAGAADDADDPT